MFTTLVPIPVLIFIDYMICVRYFLSPSLSLLICKMGLGDLLGRPNEDTCENAWKFQLQYDIVQLEYLGALSPKVRSLLETV